MTATEQRDAIPPAYALAMAQRERLLSRVSALESELGTSGRSAPVSVMRDLVERARFSINVSLADCLTFVRSGRWLNVREAAELSGLVGEALDAELSRRQRQWRARREIVEPLLRFGPDVHYGALNVGGPGPDDFGVCCLVFDLDVFPHATCFAGDTLRVCFDEAGNRLMSDEDILARFATMADRSAIAILRHEQTLRGTGGVVDLSDWKSLLEHRDGLIEAHIHGPVAIEHLTMVLMRRDDHARYQQLAARIPPDGPVAHELAEARLYLQLLPELQGRGIFFATVHL